MILVGVTHPATEGARFDLDGHTSRHLPLVRSRWGDRGLVETRAPRGIGAPDGGPAICHPTALPTFRSEESFRRAARQHGGEIMDDIETFAASKPMVQFDGRIR